MANDNFSHSNAISLIPSFFLIINSLNGMYDIYAVVGQKSMFYYQDFSNSDYEYLSLDFFM